QIKEESKRKRLKRQWELLVKRADDWFKESEQPPNFVMMVLRGDRVEWKAPDHMKAFVNSPTVLDKFKQVSLAQLYMPIQGKDVARQTEEPLELPYADSSKYRGMEFMEKQHIGQKIGLHGGQQMFVFPLLTPVPKLNIMFIFTACFEYQFVIKFLSFTKLIEIAAESIIGLFNNGRRHWILVIISTSARRMIILDPLGEVDASLTGFLSTWKSFLANSNRHVHMTLWTDWEVVALPHTKQPDSTSCGIFCLKFAEKFLHNDDFIGKNQDSAIIELCRLCGCSMPSGKENRVQWIGCDKCGEFWFHYQCMKTNMSYNAVCESRYICVFCES
ncbi:hypothetical protein ACJMK2_041235, partial [Sinanodonta woodiana]